MPNVQRIIERILTSPRAQKSSAFAGRVFSDEPILRRGSQMSSYLPERCRTMRALAFSPELRAKPEALVFYRQARFMEDYADDVAYQGSFEHYFPTYQSMSNQQLRGYFTWRAAVRAGEFQQTSLSFAFVYLYELLCGIGVEPGVVGFHAIEEFWQAYRTFDPRLDRYVRPWLRDYAVWHGLDQKLLEPYVDLEFDRALVALRDGLAAWEGPGTPGAEAGPAAHHTAVADAADNPAQEPMLAALDKLSSYRLRVSRLWREHPDTLGHVSCAVLADLAHYYNVHRKMGLMESLFGCPLAKPYEMFASAVFWSDELHADTTYELDEIRRYTCVRGHWYWEGYHGSSTRNARLGMVLRAVDQRLREALNYKHPLAARQIPKYLARIIDREVQARLTWECEREKRAVHVDLSQLALIRAASSTTREALLVDEERPDAHASEPPACLDPPAAQPKAQTSGPLGLTAQELTLLNALLDGRPFKQSAPTSLNMLVDGVNEKLLDLLGDTALEFNGTTVTIIGEYLEDVRGAVRP